MLDVQFKVDTKIFFSGYRIFSLSHIHTHTLTHCHYLIGVSSTDEGYHESSSSHCSEK